VELRRLEAVRGVRLTGHTGGGVLSLRVSGSAAAPGRVRLSQSGLLRGRLGGRRVSVRLASVASASSVTPAGAGLAGPWRPAARRPAARFRVR
jgi:hypothetical protein